jgi:hypothetical protein
MLDEIGANLRAHVALSACQDVHLGPLAQCQSVTNVGGEFRIVSCETVSVSGDLRDETKLSHETRVEWHGR